MTVESGNDLETQIAEWRAYVQRRRELRQPDADELEDHLRGRIGDLVAAGLQPDEAFLIAVKRMGALDELSREFAREHSDRLWKQLVLSDDPTTPTGTRSRRDIAVMVAFALAAAAAIKIPSLFGLDWTHGDEAFTPATSASSRSARSPRTSRTGGGSARRRSAYSRLFSWSGPWRSTRTR